MDVFRAIVVSVLLFGAAFGVYHSNGPFPLGSFDSAPNSLLGFDLFSRGRVDFDVLRGGDLVKRGAAYAFVETPSGHYASIFPMGTAIVTLPLYAAFDAGRHLMGKPVDIAAPDFDAARQLDEKAASTIIAALAVVLFFFCARLIAGDVAAAIGTLAFGFGTTMWTIASQALWQHGPVCLVLLGMIFSFQRASRSASDASRRGWLLAAGLCAGLLITIRPTSAVFSLAAFAFALRYERRALGLFAFGLVTGVAPMLVWNASFFHDLFGGYTANLTTFSSSFGDAAVAFAGELFSPNRGLFIFTPIVIFSIAGAMRAARSRTADGTLLLWLGGACVLLCAVYALYSQWYGGWTYGPRFLTDTMPVAGLLLVYTIPQLRLAAIPFAVLLAASICVQIVGANSGVAGVRWNVTPRTIDADPARVWDWSDLQIVWNARTAFDQFAPPNLKAIPPLTR